MVVKALLLFICCATLSQQIPTQTIRVAKEECILYLRVRYIELKSLEGYQIFSRTIDSSEREGYILSFSTSDVERLEKNTFIGGDSVNGFAGVLGIELDNKNLSFIEDGAFRGLPCLETLDLSRNNLTNLSQEMFSGLDNLEKLDVSFNAIQSVELREFGMKNLSFFNFSHNAIESLTLIGTFAKLKILDLGYNRIVYVEERSFEFLSSLEELYLDHNGICNFVINEIVIPRTLKNLDLSCNQLQSIIIDSVVNLEVLNISHNHLTSIMTLDYHFDFGELKVLDIRNNPWECRNVKAIQRVF